MIAFSDAQTLLHAHAPDLPSERLAADQALGRISRETINACLDLPSFHNSAMDGYAFAHASLPDNHQLSVQGQIVAGDTGQEYANPACVEIMTGAPVPEGLDTVIPVEKTKVLSSNDVDNPTLIQLTPPIKHGQNVRLAGQDIAVGTPIVTEGQALSSQHLMMLAAQGISDISVAQQPSIGLLSTGKELRQAGEALEHQGQIFDANQPFLQAYLNVLSLTSDSLGSLTHDSPEAFENLLQTQMDNFDIIISTGAVSAGRYDYIPDCLRKLGAEILFHKVAIRPAKPILCAKLPTGGLYFGLPGNPISAAIGMRFFVVPVLRKMLGQSIEQPIQLPLDQAHATKSGFRFFRKGKIQLSDSGQLSAQVLPGQESFKISPLLDTNAWLVFPESSQEYPKGSLIDVYPFLPNTLELA